MKCELNIDDAHMAINNFVGTFAFVKPGISEISSLSGHETDLLMRELAWRALLKGRKDAIENATSDSWFFVGLNGVRLYLPKYTIMTMRNCITASVDGSIDLMVETAHSEKMKAELSDGSLFLDVGAATGAMSIPYAVSKFADIRIAAFEPSRRARGYLEATVARNNIENVQIMPFAVSNEVGSFNFIELPEDTTGDIPFLPEVSRLSVTNEVLAYEGQQSFNVDVTTLDAQIELLEFAKAKNIVIKIDVEGFEDKVLLGAHETLTRYKPFLSIDIHVHPGKQELTDIACIEILNRYGYKFERSGHVLLARA